MAKRLNTTFWTGEQLHTDADIPNHDDMSYGTGYCDCTNISTSKIQAVLGSASHQVFDLSQYDGTFVVGGEAGHINAWARYKPGEVSYDDELPTAVDGNPTFIYTKPDQGDMGSWAGYNHSENTRPVYWVEGKGDYNEGMIMSGQTRAIKGGLSRGKLGPILGAPEEEYYWGRVKVECYVKVNAGSYPGTPTTTSGFIDLSEPTGEDGTLIYTMGSNSETVGNTYTVCERGVYLDVNDDIVAVIEDGVRIFHYEYVGANEYFQLTPEDTDNATTCTKPGQYNHIDYDFYVYNADTEATGELDFRIHYYGDWVNQYYEVGDNIVIAGSGSYHFMGHHDLTGTIPDRGTMDLSCEIRFGAGDWSVIGTVFKDDLAHEAQ